MTVAYNVAISYHWKLKKTNFSVKCKLHIWSAGFTIWRMTLIYIPYTARNTELMNSRKLSQISSTTHGNLHFFTPAVSISLFLTKQVHLPNRYATIVLHFTNPVMRCLTAMPPDLKEVSLFFVSCGRYFSKSNTHTCIFQGCWKAPTNSLASSMVRPDTELEYQVSSGFLRATWWSPQCVGWRPISSPHPWVRWKYAWNTELDLELQAVYPMLRLDNKRWLATTQL